MSSTETGSIDPVESGRLSALRKRLPLWLAVGAAVALGIGLLGDAPRVGAAFLNFRWELLPFILGLTLLNYLLRFVKWQYYLRIIGAPSMLWTESMLIFVSGLAMTMTPGKVGEWLKSFLLRERHGLAFATSAPIIIAERLTDGVAMLILASGGLLVYGYGTELLVLIAIGAVGLVVFTQIRAIPLAMLTMFEGMPILSIRVPHLRAFYESTHRLFSLGPLLLAVLLGLISWGGECVAMHLVLVGLGITSTPELLLQSTFILASSSLLGSASMLPGGLAVADGTIAGMLLVLGVTSDVAIAAAATLLIRFCTLWFGIGVGVLGLVGLDRAPKPINSLARSAQ